MIKAANRAGIPIVLYNRPPAEGAGKCVTVVADNFEITRNTVTYMAEQAKTSGGKHKAMILIGDLGDTNAIGRRDGFEAAVEPYADVIEVVARVPTEWNQEKALAGVTNALQANPDIDFIFTSSDFLFPSIVSALKQAGKYRKVGEPGHVLLGGFDGDATAYRMLADGYLDADGVQDVAFECEQSVQAVFDLKAGQGRAASDPRPRVRRPPGKPGRGESAHVGRKGAEVTGLPRRLPRRPWRRRSRRGDCRPRPACGNSRAVALRIRGVAAGGRATSSSRGAFVPDLAAPRNLSNLVGQRLPCWRWRGADGGADRGRDRPSVTAVIAACSVASARTHDRGRPTGAYAPARQMVPAAVAAALGLGRAIGLFNGPPWRRLGCPRSWSRSARSMVVGGATLWATQSRTSPTCRTSFTALGLRPVAGLPYFVPLVARLALALTSCWPARCRGGGSTRRAQPAAALISGVPVRRVPGGVRASGLRGGRGPALYGPLEGRLAHDGP